MNKNINLKAQKTCIFGIQGSGKTYLARELANKNFKRPFIFMVNTDDEWEKLPNAIIYKADRLNLLNDFKIFIKQAYRLAKAGKIDSIFIDEADLFFRGNYDIDPVEFLDLVLNHRHIPDNVGTALIFLTRRPQDIPTKIVESSKFLIIFKLEGKNAIERFNDIHKELPPMIESLSYEKHEYIIKEIGKAPIKG